MKVSRYILLSLLSYLAACAWWMAGRRDEQPKLNFSHALHLEQGVECSGCHAGVAEAPDVKASYLPSGNECSDCHEEGSCAPCSELAPRRAEGHEWSGLNFSHADHMKRAPGTECTVCHRDAKTATTMPVERPPMDTCLKCHDHAREYSESVCLNCHATLQRLPLKAVAEFDHAGDWGTRHGLLSRQDGATCQGCHVQSMCASCHSQVSPAAPARLFPEKVDGTVLHKGDFLTQHQIDARADGDTCLRCHNQRYCEDCHTRNGLTQNSATVRNPHPAGWLSRQADDFHGDEARLRPESCVACHDQGQASNCVVCHRVGAAGGNPHPSGFLADHDLDDTRKQASCRYCHTAQ